MAAFAGVLITIPAVGLAASASAHASSLTYYLHGTATDDASRVQGTPTATFDTTAPTGNIDRTQTGPSAQRPSGPADSHEPYWIAPVSGSQQFWGTVQIAWYWSTANPDAVAVGTQIDVNVYTNVNVAANTGTLLGSAAEPMQLSAAASLQTVTVNLSGVATDNLLIQAAGHFLDAGEGVIAHHDSTTAPSSFVLAVGPQPPPPPGPKSAAPEDWTQVGSYLPPSIRQAPAMVDDAATHNVVLFGGGTPVPGQCGLNADTWTWDGTRWSPQSPPTSPSARDYAAAAYDAADHDVVLFGGLSCNAVVGDTWTWDGTTWTEQHPATSPPARLMANMAYDPASGKLVLFGGATVAPNGGPAPVGDTWTWDGHTWAQQTTAVPSPSPRFSFGFADGSTTMAPMLFGGSNGQAALNDTWTWNGTADSWALQASATTSAPAARTGQTMAYDPVVGKDVLNGGASNITLQTAPNCLLPVCGEGSSFFGDTWTWDGSQWAQVNTALGDQDTEELSGMAFDPVDQNLVLFIGVSGHTAWSNATWGFDGTSWSLEGQLAPDEMEAARLAREPGDSSTALLFAGQDEGGRGTAKTWRWDGAQWHLLSPAHSPTPRLLNAIAYDAAMGSTILFGGFVTEYACSSNGCSATTYMDVNDTWSWNGSDWTQLNPATSPPARDHASMTYDAATGQLVLFGGVDNNGHLLNDTWTFDGSTWTQQQPSTSPSSRLDASFDYDPATANSVLFGGADLSGSEFGDTWVWTGSDWQQAQPANSPSARSAQGVAYDPTSQSLILFGGCAAAQCATSGIPADTWSWDGATWTQWGTVHTPAGRASQAVVDGDAQSPLLMFGGNQPFAGAYASGTSALNDVWAFGVPGSPPAQVPETPAVPALAVLGIVGVVTRAVARRRAAGCRARRQGA